MGRSLISLVGDIGQYVGLKVWGLGFKLLEGGLYGGLDMGSIIGLIKGDTRNLDYSSYGTSTCCRHYEYSHY